MTKGAYQLHLRIDKSVRIKVGKLGTFLFPAGRYVYTGSALNGLENRLARHFRKRKKLHWHIDYLLRYARIESVRVVKTDRRIECELNRQVLNRPNAKIIAKGFGSSDCSCPSHLVYLGDGESDKSKGVRDDA
jgi:sugar fermentation stimulation protein A